MTDESVPQTQPPPKKDEKKSLNASIRAPKKNGQNVPNARVASGASAQGGPRPSSRGSNKKSTPVGATESGSDSAYKKPTENNKKPEQRNKNHGGNRSVSHRKTQQSASQSRPKDQFSAKQSPSPAPSAQVKESDALSSLQRVIADLKTSSPLQTQPSNSNSPYLVSAPQSNVTTNITPFPSGPQPFPTTTSADPKHRKAMSLGAPGLSTNFNSFTPNLGSMLEDVEDNQSFEEGEVPEQYLPQSTHPARSLPQGFVAPRFAALAAQQEQSEPLGPTGRPQLAPHFMFGKKMAPPISEEDIGFQFPQQQPNYRAQMLEQTNSKSDNGEITGIMAEQIAIQNQIEALQQQQQALYQQQLASNQVLSFQTPGLVPNRHRRVHSTVPMGSGSNINYAGLPNTMHMHMPVPGNANIRALNLALDRESDGAPRGHGRRHSVNVVNKTSTSGGSSFGIPYNGQDNFEDGFTPPVSFGGHSRQVSRVDPAWRLNGGLGMQGNNFATDLAQAQAQLQSLQQFRAAAGGHHHKMQSFSLPNMLPNMMAANMMGLGLGGINFIQQQQQQFQSQIQQQSNQPQRKSLFAPYLPQASLPPLLAAGKLVVGILRVNKRNRSDAYVATEVLDADIYICGSKDRNRALEGDIVAVELLEVDEVWSTKKEKEEKKRKKEENAAYDLKSGAGRKDDKKKDDVEVEGQGLMLFEDEEVTDEVKPQFAGHVVAVVERMPGQLFSGTLALLRPAAAATKEKQEAERREREGDRADETKRPQERPKIVWFKPTDKRVPLIAIPTEQAPPDFVENEQAYANRLFVACIKRHPISSLHPFGTLVEELGPIGDIEVETSALLKDCNFPTEEFTENVLKCLPPMPWTIPERELEARKDLRNERIFTIDPVTAKDLDDAISIKSNDDGTYEVGIHIADVSYFVKPNTALDRDARKRATSVYLVQRAVPMLPPSLSEQLCSLVPGEDRLTFSVMLTISEDAKVLKKWFGKAVIRSAAKLSYSDVQKVIDDHDTIGESIVAIRGHKYEDVKADIKTLEKLSKKLRNERFANGALNLENLKLEFKLDNNGLPVDCGLYERTDAHSLVEEFMLLTNITVAQHIAVYLPEQALLRRHDSPLERRIKTFGERAQRLGYTMDTTSAGALMRSLEAVRDPTARKMLEMLSLKATQRAKYFCAGMLDIAKYSHYSLSAPLYTHFTSPIRRYADIIVHRQLDAVLQSGEPKFTMDRDAVAKVAQQCNIKRDSSALAQEQSAHLFLCVLISDLTHRYGPVIRQAKVVNVLDAAFDVLVPEFGIEKRVHVDQMPIDNHVYDEHTDTLQIYWSNRDVITWLAENSDDEHLKKVKQNAEQHALKMEVVSRPVQDEKALFEEDDADDDDEIVLGRDDEMWEEIDTSKQRLLSKAKVKPEFEGLRITSSGHKIQDIRVLMTVPVIVTADLRKSPPVIKVYSVNPYAETKN
ncbi:hypothetical protein AMATHDRAFT_56203 [Amanita thiersii Skay4041]|uniref:DIS3-like exonuclease 2 n=1 Tax=Amanita thiersii Skay4041 TaxID=703135 RepID=A0A2A9NQE1_9AGAR|nr:hypothetical protein AMATHDRAFT_56203 [Amanita thiersii Skay4041]